MKMGLRDIGATLPPGFKFNPSDEELVCHYLYKKISNEDNLKAGTLVEIDLHTCEPWELPEVAKLNSTEWYFFSFRDRKYATGYRANRATKSGYWKATGKDRIVLDPKSGGVVGLRKTLVFYKNRAPNGIKTAWIMHEFRLHNPHLPPKEDWVLCRVFEKPKSEENTNSSSYLQEDITKLSPPNSTQQQTTSFPQTSTHLLQYCNPTNINFLHQSPSNPTFLHLSQTPDHPINDMTFINSNSEEDAYNFLFDDGVSSAMIEDMRFDEEDINTGLVFL